MVSLLWRCAACVVGFAFGAVWMTAGISAALGALICAGLFYAVTLVVQRRRLDRSAGRFFAARLDREPRQTVERPRPQSRPRPERRKPAVAEHGW
jgi:hypothetical protein